MKSIPKTSRRQPQKGGRIIRFQPSPGSETLKVTKVFSDHEWKPVVHELFFVQGYDISEIVAHIQDRFPGIHADLVVDCIHEQDALACTQTFYKNLFDTTLSGITYECAWDDRNATTQTQQALDTYDRGYILENFAGEIYYMYHTSVAGRGDENRYQLIRRIQRTFAYSSRTDLKEGDIEACIHLYENAILAVTEAYTHQGYSICTEVLRARVLQSMQQDIATRALHEHGANTPTLLDSHGQLEHLIETCLLEEPTMIRAA